MSASFWCSKSSVCAIALYIASNVFFYTLPTIRISDCYMFCVVDEQQHKIKLLSCSCKIVFKNLKDHSIYFVPLIGAFLETHQSWLGNKNCWTLKTYFFCFSNQATNNAIFFKTKCRCHFLTLSVFGLTNYWSLGHKTSLKFRSEGTVTLHFDAALRISAVKTIFY